MSNIEIVDYNDSYDKAVREISLAWLKKYDLLEDVDLVMLENLREKIVDRGGHVYVALYDNKPAGTISLMPAENNAFEILKYGVSENFRRLGIGQALMQHVIKVSKFAGKSKIILCTNHQLSAAIRIYEQFGFILVPYGKTEYEMSDMKMELML